MQNELATEYPTLPITILAINEIGYEDGNDAMAAVGDLALMQDETATYVWDAWAASWRDVVLLDADNVEVYRFNLSTYSLTDTRNYDHLKAVFVAVAEGSPIPAGP